MSVKDVIKNSVLKGISEGAGLSIGEICIILIAACAIGIYIYFIYKNMSKSAFYSKDLNITLAGMTIIVAAIMIAMQSNLLVSLGMVGALSIVRFRTAVKNPVDLLYLFWGISEGIIIGVDLLLLAVGLCVIMTALVLILERVPSAKASSVLILRSVDDVDWAKVESVIANSTKSYKEKSRQVRGNETEVIFEIFSKEKGNLVSDLKELNCFDVINVLTHDGTLRV